MQVTVTDFRGSQITPGAVIVYPVRRGSSLNMVEGKVEQINEANISRGPELLVRRLRVSEGYAFNDYAAYASQADSTRLVKVAPNRVTVVG